MIELVVIFCGFDNLGCYIEPLPLTFESREQCDTFVSFQSNGKRWGQDFVVAYCREKKR